MSCVFCNIASHQEPAGIVYEDEVMCVFLDTHPRTRGHVQVVPKKHYRWFYDIPEMPQIFARVQQIVHAIIPVLGADHVTMATFGHGMPHAHLWIVPQYEQHAQIEEFQTIPAKDMDEHLVAILKGAIAREVSS